MGRKWVSKRITINLTKEESEILDKACAETGLGFTELIRAQIRSLEPKAIAS